MQMTPVLLNGNRPPRRAWCLPP